MIDRNGWPEYKPQEIEPKWQKIWDQEGLYLVREEAGKQKYYCLDFFPYPSGDGLHVGHCRNYIPTDVISRYKRMNGFNVLHPMGWDAFGEPAEQYAIEYGVHPRVTTDRNTGNYRRQMKMIGTSYDWSREIDSSKPEFYRWTQYFFLLFFKRGLVYRDKNWQWWCPECKTTLSSHEVDTGVCWRGHEGVTKKEIPAWYFRITAYAEELLASLDDLGWPESIKSMQRNWIGKSEGCEIEFRTEDGQTIPSFTTRADTIYGVTYIVIAPEHELVKKITLPEYQARVQSYIESSLSLSEIERSLDNKERTGVFTGGYVLNPINNDRVPVWIGDYILPGYGTGAVMGVPAHDERDYEFASRYNLPVRFVIDPVGESELQPGRAFVNDGILKDSGPFSGLSSNQGRVAISQYLSENKSGGYAVNYRMRDWLISRQRYWGTPIPIIHCETCGEQPVPEEELPVLLPKMEDFQPTIEGKSPLFKLPEFINTTCPTCGDPARRESDTMGGFACSSWYFLQFASPNCSDGPFDKNALNYWLPVDLYVGGAEHAVLHLLYSRFWTKVLADEGLVPFREPFSKLINQGHLIASDGQRMSKSRGNVITPDEIVSRFGADSLRVYELFMAPFTQDIQWSTDGFNGSYRFVNRTWNLFAQSYFGSAGAHGEDDELDRQLNKTVNIVSERIENFRFNTMISALMEFLNLLNDKFAGGGWKTSTYHDCLNTLMILLAPVAPYLAEELWQLTGHQGSIHRESWPVWSADLLVEESIQIAVQVNGKFKDVIKVDASVHEEQVREIAMESASVKKAVQAMQVKRIYYVPGKIINIIVD